MPTKGSLYLALYGAFSTTLFGISVVALASKSVDYLTFMYELTDSFRLTILLNFVICCFLIGGAVSTRVLFGELRLLEVEHMVDQLPFYALNLLFILFNDENLLLNIAWTSITILAKVYHIIVLDRLDFLQVRVVNNMSKALYTPAGILRTFSLNLYVVLLVVFVVADFFMAKILAYDVFQGVSSVGSLLFGIQFGVLGMEGFTYSGKLVLNIYELMFYRAYQEDENAEAGSAIAQTESGSAIAQAESVGSVEVGDSVEVREPIEVGDSVEVGETENHGETIDISDPTNAELVDPVEITGTPGGDDDQDEDEDDGSERVWENKAIYIQGFEIVAATLKSLFYLAFMYLLFVHSELSPPIPILQGIFVSLREVYKKFKLLRGFLEHSRNLDKLLANASQEELEAAGNLCIICREDMRSPEEYERIRAKPMNKRRWPKKLKCGHILHMGCLKDWLERSENCPLCRKSVFGSSPTEPTVRPGEVAQAPVETGAPAQEFGSRDQSTSEAPATTTLSSAPDVLAISHPTPTEFTVTTSEAIPKDWVALPISLNIGSGSFRVRLSPALLGTLNVCKQNSTDVDTYTITRD